jgi:uncharacterized protein
MPFDYNAVKDLLRCPKSHSPLVLAGDSLVCENPECRMRFEIRDEIPILLLDEATELTEAEWQAAIGRVNG